ncbi:MAG: bifunctional diaminohydroxyphosphoribosylaminopyrimidine deaminase/5-amino-6-(5-phosphoribosylamino)uracil reductase RibD [Bacteroidaceae bacterium]|nr:bifunctional diaminohydroxyphosphoribosylaminopyrimidine deaminase/5-amino-6-(5-phosphoribosylamino)uracil reductase RibD [Bacteroidaceae bacterium]
MARCLQLARCGEIGAAPNPMVGAVIVADGRIIGEGYHIRCGGPHAEVNAIASVSDPSLLAHSTIYVSLEPCAHYGKTPPCADLIIAKGIPRVVVGCADPFAKVNGLGIQRLRDAGVEVRVGVLEDECRWLNRRFITFHSQHRPWVTLKWATSSDGYIDVSRSPEEQQARFSTTFTSALVHRLRATHQAILVGTNTALADNPSLTTRLWQGANPLRLVIDRHNRLPRSLRIFNDEAPTHVYRHESLPEILIDLHRRGIQSLLVEGGSQLLQSFIREGLWDEARVETAPVMLRQGIAAPTHAQNAITMEEQVIDGNTITTYLSETTASFFHKK